MLLYPTPARTTPRHRGAAGEAELAQDRQVVEHHDRIGTRQVAGQLRLIASPGHDEVGDVVQDGGLDRSLVQEIGDQYVESISHRKLLGTRCLDEAQRRPDAGRVRTSPGPRRDRPRRSRHPPSSGRRIVTVPASSGAEPAGPRRGFQLDPLELRAGSDQGSTPQSAGKNQIKRLVSTSAPGRHRPSDLHRPGTLANGESPDDRWKSHHEGSTRGWSHKFKSGRTDQLDAQGQREGEAPGQDHRAEDRAAGRLGVEQEEDQALSGHASGI